MSEPLVEAEWRQRPEVQAIFAALDGHKRRTRAVGGVVRDTIMGRAHSGDIDMATELLPEEVMKRAKAAGIAAHPTGIDHGTVTLTLGEVLSEVTTLRRDVETGKPMATKPAGDKTKQRWGKTQKDAVRTGGRSNADRQRGRA